LIVLHDHPACRVSRLGTGLYVLSLDHVCSPHSHLNMRTVRPFCELSIVRTKTGFLSQWPHTGTGLGSKRENTSFLKSLFMDSRPPLNTKYQSEQLFLGRWAELQSGMERRQICALGCHDAGPARPSEIEQQVLWSASEGAGNAEPHLSSIFAPFFE
jgi:hypothetical protein